VTPEFSLVFYVVDQHQWLLLIRLGDAPALGYHLMGTSECRVDMDVPAIIVLRIRQTLRLHLERIER
jgi:hypothetical protein